MEDSNIRFAQETDLKELVHLCQLHAAFEKSDFESEHKEQKLGEHLFSAQPGLYCLVVEQDDKVIGYATYMRQFSTWDSNFYVYMDCLFITEESRGLGIGEKLMTRIKEETTRLGCDLIQWQTPKFNQRAMKFYNRMGGVSKTKERYFLEI